MGQLAEALRDPQRRRALHQSGGEYNYTDPVEMVRDMAALKRAFPDTRLLASDDPLRQLYGYLGYYTVEGHEVVFYFHLPMEAIRAWEGGLQMSDVQQRLLASALRTADGRRRIIQIAEDVAARPEPQPQRGARRSAWERLTDDDLPL